MLIAVTFFVRFQRASIAHIFVGVLAHFAVQPTSLIVSAKVKALVAGDIRLPSPIHGEQNFYCCSGADVFLDARFKT